MGIDILRVIIFIANLVFSSCLRLIPSQVLKTASTNDCFDYDLESLANGLTDLILRSPKTPSIQLRPEATNFDNTIEVSCSVDPQVTAMSLIDSVRPHLEESVYDLDESSKIFTTAISEAVKLMVQLSHLVPLESSCQRLQCRLTLVTSVKCPKWHEDNVQFRLLQTLYGVGTQWVHPSRVEVRVLNYLLREVLDHEAFVPSHLIASVPCGDVLIMRGKRGCYQKSRRGLMSAPVLHRSPICTEEAPRLLLSISIP